MNHHSWLIILQMKQFPDNGDFGLCHHVIAQKVSDFGTVWIFGLGMLGLNCLNLSLGW